MRYSDDIIEEVRMKNDIVDVISQYVRLTRRGSSYFGLCPFHNEKTPSFSVTPSKQMYYCFGCGAGGNVYNFVMQYENYSFGEALSHLAERAGVELPKIEYSKEARAKAEKRAALRETAGVAGLGQHFLLNSSCLQYLNLDIPDKPIPPAIGNYLEGRRKAFFLSGSASKSFSSFG